MTQQEGFTEFWKRYPRKVSKKDAEKAWAKLVPDVRLIEQMLAALEVQKQSKQWRKNDGEFVPFPATWIRGERWNDELPRQTMHVHGPASALERYQAWTYADCPHDPK